MPRPLSSTVAPSAEQSAAQTTATASASTAEPEVKRLHISGLGDSSLTPKDIESRFTSFGLTVLSVDPWSSPTAAADQSGAGSSKAGSITPAAAAAASSRPYTYVNIALPREDAAAHANLDKATRLLSGAAWKGARLRIGAARPDYAERLRAAQEREARLRAQGLIDARTGKEIKDKKKSKRGKAQGGRTKNLPGTVGAESQDVGEPVTTRDVERGEWVRCIASLVVSSVLNRDSDMRSPL